MRLTGSRTYYKSAPPKMPPGLVQLIEGLTRDVLKNNPTDIYGFCAGHMQQLLEIRDGPLQRKCLTLKEKIAKAQEKVRERAEKRRQRYDKELLDIHRSIEDLEISATSNKIMSSVSAQDSTTVTKNLIHHERELINSSEVEVSHESGSGNNSPSQNRPPANIGPEDKKNDDDLKKYTVTEHESKNESYALESTDDTNANNSINDTRVDKSNVSTDMLDNPNQVDKISCLNNLNESITDEQIRQGDDSLNDNNESVVGSSIQDFGDVSTENHLLTPVDSILLIEDCVLVDSGEKNIKDSVQVEPENTENEQNSLQALNFVTNDVAEPQSDTAHSVSDTQSIPLSTDTDISNSTTVIENVELANNVDNVVSENNSETNTIDISFKESPNVELQDACIHSDTLESLQETSIDNDIMTLITQEFNTSDELKEHNTLAHNNLTTIEAGTIVETQVHIDNTKLDITIPSREEFMDKDTQHQNQMNSNDIIENSIIESYENNNGVNNCGHDTSKKLHESSQISYQETSNMDLETAAITIQKVFRTFLFKSRGSTFEDTLSDENDKNKEECDFPIAGSLNERRPHGITRMDTVLQTVNEEKSLSLSTDDSSLSSAATVIQAHVRGFLVRNKLNSNKTFSTNSLAASNSNEPSPTSLEMDSVENKNKTVLNIHIVPEAGNYFSRDESLITSMELSLDSSPPSSISLHPLGHDVSERRKQLKREDAIQSISPPSNNSGKLSEDIDSVKELPLNDQGLMAEHEEENVDSVNNDSPKSKNVDNCNIAHVETFNVILENIVNVNEIHHEIGDPEQRRKSLTKMNSDEMDVVTPYISNEDINTPDIKLVHSGEFHDAVLPTKVSRSDTSVASEFKNVLVYFLLWNHS